MIESPNKLIGWNGKSPEGIVIHYTAGTNMSGAWNTLMNPKTKASAHIIIDKDGTIKDVVSTSNRAWHAGESTWLGRSGCNNFMLGIELVNVGYLKQEKNSEGKTIITNSYGSIFNGKSSYDDRSKLLWETYPEEQLKKLIEVIRNWQLTYGICSSMIVGHNHIAPNRKLDPGPLFPWELIEKESIKDFDTSEKHGKAIQSHLERLGFECGDIDGILGKNTKTALSECADKYKLKFSFPLDNSEIANSLRRIFK